MSSPTLVHATSLSEPTLVVFGATAPASRAHRGLIPVRQISPPKRRPDENARHGALATENSFDVSVPAGLSPPPQPPSPALTRS
jgi:hypothetical protein